MAEISFSTERTEQRFNSCKAFTEKKGDKSLQNCIESLKRWVRPVVIGCDFDEMSFTFREQMTPEEEQRGLRGVNGGIIYHGQRDGYGSGNGPTFSVTLDQADGYRIHT